MFVRRALRFAASNNKLTTSKLPKAPTLLSGQLQSFRLDGEAARIYDGYSLDQLYGNKIGFKHSPAVLAEMHKDTITCILVFILGFSIILHLNKLDKQALEELEAVNAGRVSRQVTLPEGMKNTLRPALTRDEVHL